MKSLKIIFNPFERNRNGQLLAIGIIAFIIGCILAYLLKARYNGAFDLHFSGVQNFKKAILDNLWATSFLTIIFYLGGLALNIQTKFLKILITILIMRIPLYLATLVNIFGFEDRMAEKALAIGNMGEFKQLATGELLQISIAGLVIIPFIIWMFVLLFQGFKNATQQKGLKFGLSFIGLIIVAELFSTILFLAIS